MRTLGIDEAGRGCVLGALFVGGFLVDDVPDRALLDAGACDSKAISAAKRLAAREKLRPLGTADVRAIPASAIDEASLNALEEDAIVSLIERWRPDRVVIDALGHPRSLPGIVKRLQKRTDCAEWLMEPKADATFPVVGAASIFAKTQRDEALDEIAARFGALGSGYPSDPKTKAWLRDHHATGAPWPAFVRTKWATISALGQRALF